ncbi:MAG: bifunctional UDP-N-acetylglucosamine diphosphorylase/glucosamine-1-phosphate N-acetyltransferase GlmU [Deltaproteobacteria bacterium]|nr:bifunctional UDP-N-acetylglucosamine diphosphorylase/glucosamine-1-phosphate N-acetyltransferase GlmU [Deltaproteobacteria bacterium]
MSALSAIVMAAGEGKRMRSRKPKVLHELGGRPMVRYPIELALALGASPVVVVTGHQGDVVRGAIERFGLPAVATVDQGNPKGTGHAVLTAMPALDGFDGTVLILSGDVPLLTGDTLRALVARHEQADAALTLLAMDLPDAGSYGRVLIDETGAATRIVEAKDATPEQRAIGLANAGIYAASSAFLREALPTLGNRNAQGEYYLTDLVEIAHQRGLRAVHAVVPDGDEVHGVDDRAKLARAAAILNRRTLAALMRDGVTVRDPESTWVDAGVVVGADSVLDPGAELRGATKVGEGCRIGTGAIVVDSELADGVTIKPYCVIEESRIASGAAVGPMAHLRPGSDLGADVKIGNFVEIKKATFGAGSKASHLTYVGDASVGKNVNLGCGTITCNYDGVSKFKTVIEDDVFVGSDTQLVAPVTVGRGAYIGSGSTITRDVPPDALAVARGKQRNIEGWATSSHAPSKKPRPGGDGH